MNQDKTEILPKVTKENLSQVRISSEPPKTALPPKKPKGKGWFWVKVGIFILVFGAGCFIGFRLMSNWETTTQSNYNSKVHKVNTLEEKENNLSIQEEALANKHDKLSATIADLEAEKKDLTKDKNVFQSLIDEITGKADEEAAQVDVIDKKIAKTKATLKEIDQGLDKVKKLKDQTANLKAEAKDDLLRYESQWEGFVYKFKLFIGNLTK